MEAVQSKEQMAQQKPQEDESIDPTSVRGILGGLGKKMARKKIEEGREPKTRATVFTMNNELLKVSTNVAGNDLSIPAGFKEKR